MLALGARCPRFKSWQGPRYLFYVCGCEGRNEIVGKAARPFFSFFCFFFFQNGWREPETKEKGKRDTKRPPERTEKRHFKTTAHATAVAVAAGIRTRTRDCPAADAGGPGRARGRLVAGPLDAVEAESRQVRLLRLRQPRRQDHRHVSLLLPQLLR